LKHLRTVVSPANLVTLTRLLLAPLLFVLVLNNNDRDGVTWGGFVLGVVLASTDYFDGILARRRGTVSRWGAFLDPLADKVVVIGVAVCLVVVERYGWVPVTLLAVREGVITLYRLWFARRGLAVPSRRLAKWKTFVQGTALLLAVLPPLQEAEVVVQMSLWLAVAFTLITGVQYLVDGSRATSMTGSRSA